jgi:hypothetical protein
MRPIGGFFELELPSEGKHYHPDAIGLSTGRACLGVFNDQVKPKKVFVPYYTCDATYHPFQLRDIPLSYYEIKVDLEPLFLPQLNEGEYFLYTNYLGVKEDYVLKLREYYGSQLLVDNTHCFFQKGYEGIWSFTSARKHFGIPDGAFLYSGSKLEANFPAFEGITLSPYFNRFLGNQALAFQQYQEYEASLNCKIHGISHYSERMLGVVDFEKVREKRIENFNYLQDTLKDQNQLGVMDSQSPFCYPLWPKKEIKHRDFHQNKVFIPSYWKEIQSRINSENSFSVALSNQLLPLPIDHRYGKEEMDRMIEIVQSF